MTVSEKRSEESVLMLGLPLTRCDRNIWKGDLPLETWSHYGDALAQFFPQKVGSSFELLVQCILKKVPVDYLGQQSASLQYLLDYQKAI